MRGDWMYGAGIRSNWKGVGAPTFEAIPARRHHRREKEGHDSQERRAFLKPPPLRGIDKKGMKKTKIHFGKLVNWVDTHTSMFLLDWMIKTGIPFKQRTGRWTVAGISQRLLDYSANEHAHKFNLFRYFDHNCASDFFTAVFARAVYSIPNKPIKEWRESERIYPDKYRYFHIDYGMPCSQRDHEAGIYNTNGFIWYLSSLIGSYLVKENHHPDYNERTEPKIVSERLYTVGSGWVFEYTFSFKEFGYEPGWDKSFRQQNGESIPQFLWRTVQEMDKLIEKEATHE